MYENWSKSRATQYGLVLHPLNCLKKLKNSKDYQKIIAMLKFFALERKFPEHLKMKCVYAVVNRCLCICLKVSGGFKCFDAIDELEKIVSAIWLSFVLKFLSARACIVWKPIHWLAVENGWLVLNCVNFQ